jgi:hypothetical protein
MEKPIIGVKTMKAKITIEMDNAAFRENQGFELSRILEYLSNQAGRRDIWNKGDTIKLYDKNGNIVGQCKFTK